MERTGIKTSIFGFIVNLALFLIKLYVGISSGSLAIYCDSINNLGDAVACIIAFVGFISAIRLNDKKSQRVQALCTFVIGIILTVTGAYFAYNGVSRLMYPVKISYLGKYAFLILLTMVIKLIMALIYTKINKKQPSAVFKALIMDSYLDTAITLCAFFSLTLSVKINFAIDGVISIAIGIIITVSAIKTIINEGKFLINE